MSLNLTVRLIHFVRTAGFGAPFELTDRSAWRGLPPVCSGSLEVPAKHHATNVSVGRPDIQAFVGSLVGHGSSKGVFVTTSSFSTPAVEFVRHLSQRVILIDGAALADLMIEHGVGVRVSRAVEIKKVDLDFFDPG